MKIDAEGILKVPLFENIFAIFFIWLSLYNTVFCVDTHRIIIFLGYIHGYPHFL
jgi:hypothetical protein